MLFLEYMALDKPFVKLSRYIGACSGRAVMESEVPYRVATSSYSPGGRS